jgi:hypothetical protein
MLWLILAYLILSILIHSYPLSILAVPCCVRLYLGLHVFACFCHLLPIYLTWSLGRVEPSQGEVDTKPGSSNGSSWSQNNIQHMQTKDNKRHAKATFNGNAWQIWQLTVRSANQVPRTLRRPFQFSKSSSFRFRSFGGMVSTDASQPKMAQGCSRMPKDAQGIKHDKTW